LGLTLVNAYAGILGGRAEARLLERDLLCVTLELPANGS
jgi:hypothetical protein